MIPNTLELFYKVKGGKSANYMVNAISSPDDSGVGAKVDFKF